jgi:hypothetical protein
MSTPDSHPDPLRERLERAAHDLVYSSEGDNPFEYVAVEAPPGARSESAQELAAILAGREGGDRVEERSLDDFFKRHIETSDPYDSRAQAIRPRYEALRELLRSSLSGVRVVRLTRAANRAVVRCFVVGRDRAGRIVGLATSAIET